MFYIDWTFKLYNQPVTTNGETHGTPDALPITSSHVAFWYWLSLLNFGPNQVKRKQYGFVKWSVLFCVTTGIDNPSESTSISIVEY